jgi:hypothetical protein
MILRLIQGRVHSSGEQTLIPMDDSSLIMLGHCSHGSIEVTEKYWDRVVKPLVEWHKWSWEIHKNDAPRT